MTKRQSDKATKLQSCKVLKVKSCRLGHGHGHRLINFVGRFRTVFQVDREERRINFGKPLQNLLVIANEMRRSFFRSFNREIASQARNVKLNFWDFAKAF